jgi:hypothetical protein
VIADMHSQEGPVVILSTVDRYPVGALEVGGAFGRASDIGDVLYLPTRSSSLYCPRF